MAGADGTEFDDQELSGAVVFIQSHLSVAISSNYSASLVQIATRTDMTHTQAHEVAKAVQVCTAAFVVCFTVVVGWLWKKSSESQLANQAKPGNHRERLLDNAKGIAILCVVLCHFCVTFVKIPFFQALMAATTMVNNPFFALVSGFCSQSPPTFKKVRDLITHLALPAALHMTFVKPVVLLSIVNPSELHERLWAFFHFKTISNLWDLTWIDETWYLFALMFWRLLSLTCFAHLNSYSVVALCSLISCAGAFGLAGNLFIVNFAVGYLPYFTCGYLLDLKTVIDTASGVSTLPVGLRFAGVAGCVLFMNMRMLGMTYLPALWPEDRIAVCFFCGTKYDYGIFLVEHFMHFTVTVSVCLLMLLFVVPRAETWLSGVGKASLYVYLHHRVVLTPCENLTQFRNDSTMAWISSSIIGLLVFATYGYCVSVAAALLLTSKPWVWLWSWALEPTWADALTRPSNFETAPEAPTGSAGLSGPAQPQHAADKGTAEHAILGKA